MLVTRCRNENLPRSIVRCRRSDWLHQSEDASYCAIVGRARAFASRASAYRSVCETFMYMWRVSETAFNTGSNSSLVMGSAARRRSFGTGSESSIPAVMTAAIMPWPAPPVIGASRLMLAAHSAQTWSSSCVFIISLLFSAAAECSLSVSTFILIRLYYQLEHPSRFQDASDLEAVSGFVEAGWLRYRDHPAKRMPATNC